MDQIIIRDLVARGIIGLNSWEREKPQEILINITLFADPRRPGRAMTWLTRSITASSPKKPSLTPKRPNV